MTLNSAPDHLPEGAPRPPASVPHPALAKIRAARGLTQAGMLLERVLRCFWPLFCFVVVGVALVAFGATEVDLLWLRGGLGLGWLLTMGLGIWWGAQRFHWPTQAEALARLDAGLPGRPIAALSDSMALGGADAGAQALWAAHLARMSARLDGLRPVAPHPDLPRRDPFALRLVAMTALVMALGFGLWGRAPSGVVTPGSLGGVQQASGPSWEGWAEPPHYTGRPGLYLNPLGEVPLEIPAGTRLTFRLYGAPGEIALNESVSVPTPAPIAAPEAPAGAAAPSAPEGVQSFEFVAEHTGQVRISGVTGRNFDLIVLPDLAPQVEPLSPATRRADGKLSQSFRASDDYAVTSGTATITLDMAALDRRFGLAVEPEPREPLVFDLPLPLTGNRADFSEVLVEDAATHPWANLPVKIQLEVTDGRGQTGQSAPLSLDLPGKRFFDPIAAAVIEMRRDLLWSVANGPRVAQILHAVTYKPEGFMRNERAWLLLRVAMRRLDQGLTLGPLTPELRDELAEAFWKVAELLEDGGLSDALAAMQQAQERLTEAMRNGASPDEIAKLMQDLKKATDDYIAMLAERGQEQDPADRFAQNQPDTQNITGDQIQQMMDEIQKLMEEGRMAEAQELLDQLARMMQNLQVTQGQGGQNGGPGQQAMKDLGDTLRQQQDLSDQAFRDLQDNFNPGGAPKRNSEQGQNGPQGPNSGRGLNSEQGQNNQGQNSQGENGQPGGPGTPQAPDGQNGAGQNGAGSGDLATRQRDLRRELGRQQGLLPRTGSEADDTARQRLDEAGRAMEEAEQALRDGDNGQALDRQADAIEALREGMRSLGEALAQQSGGQQGERNSQDQARAGGQGGDREVPRDPLGRNMGQSGTMGSGDSLLQGEDVYRRARDLLDEIRRRSGERLRPEAELDYLKRLLDQF
jgi:uncharacterized protein (TIGR02302 family)